MRNAAQPSEALLDIKHIKGHCYMSHPHSNPTRVVPAGPRLWFLVEDD